MKKYTAIIWGAGDGGARVLNLLPDVFIIDAFIDVDEDKVGKLFFGYPVIKKEAIHEVEFDYIIIANIYGYEIKKWLIENNIDSSKIIDFFNNGYNDIRLSTLRYIADEINYSNIKGDVAELGVFQGEFARYINILFPHKKLYLFDTFEGFNEQDIIIESLKGFSNSNVGEFNNTSVECVLSKMPYIENCIIKKGFFPDSAEGVDTKFSFVSLDVDLYNPIYAGLEYFYERIVDGGYIMVHDYNSTRYEGVKEAVRTFSKFNNIRFVPISDLCGSIVICK